MQLKLIKVIPKRESRGLFLRETELFPPPLNSETSIMTRKFFFKIRPQENKNKIKIKVWNFFILFPFYFYWPIFLIVRFLSFCTLLIAHPTVLRQRCVKSERNVPFMNCTLVAIQYLDISFFFFGKENTSLSILSLNPPKDPLMWLEKFYH